MDTYVNFFPFLVKGITGTSSGMVFTDELAIHHATTNPRATQGVLSGIDPKFLNPESRFGAAFYIADDPATAVAELAHHNATATHSIRFDFGLSKARILDLTNPQIAAQWQYSGGPISSSTQLTGLLAKAQGYNVIKFNSLRGRGVNYEVVYSFRKSVGRLLNW